MPETAPLPIQSPPSTVPPCPFSGEDPPSWGGHADGRVRPEIRPLQSRRIGKFSGSTFTSPHTSVEITDVNPSAFIKVQPGSGTTPNKKREICRAAYLLLWRRIVPSVGRVRVSKTCPDMFLQPVQTQFPIKKQKTCHIASLLFWWGMVDSNHRRHSQQIYSLSPLATREIPHMNLSMPLSLGAGRRTRTPDLLITNQLLYQLSYTSISRA